MCFSPAGEDAPKILEWRLSKAKLMIGGVTVWPSKKPVALFSIVADRLWIQLIELAQKVDGCVAGWEKRKTRPTSAKPLVVAKKHCHTWRKMLPWDDVFWLGAGARFFTWLSVVCSLGKVKNAFGVPRANLALQSQFLMNLGYAQKQKQSFYPKCSWRINFVCYS